MDRLAIDDGLERGFGGTFLRCASGLGMAGGKSNGGGLGRNPSCFGIDGAGVVGKPGGGGARAGGGFSTGGLPDVSESECAPSSPAPVSMPPLRCFNFGIPPANSPPSWGAPPTPLSAWLRLPVSLLLRPRVACPGMGGARELGALISGTGGALPTGPAPAPGFLSSMGADRSFVTAFLSLAPFVMSDNSAPCADPISGDFKHEISHQI